MSVQDVKLSPEVEPFIPQKKGFEGSLVSMSLSGEAGGGGGGVGIGGGSGGVETAPIPSYLITCYPFVQENQPNRYCSAVTVGDRTLNETSTQSQTCAESTRAFSFRVIYSFNSKS